MSKLGKEEHKRHFWKSLSHKMTKSCIVSSLSNKRNEKTWGRGKRSYSKLWISFNERESSFSLEIRAIRPSAVFGTRRRTALRGEGFACVPDLGSFLKL